MIDDVAEQRCEYEGCGELAVGWAEAHWSLFDFHRYELCDAHMDDVLNRLEQIVIDGNPAALGWGHYWPTD